MNVEEPPCCDGAPGASGADGNFDLHGHLHAMRVTRAEGKSASGGFLSEAEVDAAKTTTADNCDVLSADEPGVYGSKRVQVAVEQAVTAALADAARVHAEELARARRDAGVVLDGALAEVQAEGERRSAAAVAAAEARAAEVAAKAAAEAEAAVAAAREEARDAAVALLEARVASTNLRTS